MNPYPYQLQGIQFLQDRHAALLADAPRLGKTCMVLNAALQVSKKAPVLVCGPAIARGTWERECATWRPDLRVRRIEHRGEFRFPRAGELVVSSYELTPASFCDQDIEPGTILVGDEIQRCSYITAGRTQKMEQLCFATRRRGGRVWLLSATPIENNPIQMWNVIGLLSSQQLCFGSYSGFLESFQGRPGGRGIVWGLPLPCVPEQLARVMLRRTRAEVSPQLQRNTVQIIPVPLSSDATRLSDASLRAIAKRGLTLSEASRLANTHAYATRPAWISTISRTKSAIAVSKLPYALQLIENYEAAGEPFVVFSASRGVVDAIGKRPGWGTITGDSSPRRREDVQQQFREGRILGVAATIQAGGTAIDLSTACALLFVDLTWDPGSVQQAAERIQGPRQSRPTTTMFLQSYHPLEAHLWDLAAVKAEIIRLAMRRSSVA